MNIPNSSNNVASEAAEGSRTSSSPREARGGRPNTESRTRDERRGRHRDAARSQRSRGTELDARDRGAGDDDLAEPVFDMREAAERVIDEVRRRPVAAVAAAFGLGVAVSHVFSSRLARMAVVAAGGYAVKELFGGRLIDVLREEGDELLEFAEERIPRVTRESSP